MVIQSKCTCHVPYLISVLFDIIDHSFLPETLPPSTLWHHPLPVLLWHRPVLVLSAFTGNPPPALSKCCQVVWPKRIDWIGSNPGSVAHNVWPWANTIPSLSLSFLSCKMGVASMPGVVVENSENTCEAPITPPWLEVSWQQKLYFQGTHGVLRELFWHWRFDKIVKKCPHVQMGLSKHSSLNLFIS